VPEPSAKNHLATGATMLGFTFALGTGMLVLPLLALAAGYDAIAVGLLTAVAAISQVGLRLLLPWLLGRFADRDLIATACLMIASSYAVLIATQELVPFIVAQLLQGGARAMFWTSSQTHAVRGSGSSVKSLARVQLVGNVGTLSGPPIAGIAAVASLQAALGLGASIALVGAVFSRAMADLAPFDRQRRVGEPRIWRRPGVDVACWAGFTAGGWRAMLGSYVPVVLASAGLSPSITGGLLALADGASIAVAAVLVRHSPRNMRRAVDVGVLVCCLGLGLVSVVASEPAIVGLFIAIGGAGSGVLTTIGPALASDSVRPDERGDAIAAAGTFRAAALFATPAGVAAGLAWVPLPVGLAIAAVGLAAPAVIAGIRTGRRSHDVR
jgi:hypothetical protein